MDFYVCIYIYILEEDDVLAYVCVISEVSRKVEVQEAPDLVIFLDCQYILHGKETHESLTLPFGPMAESCRAPDILALHTQFYQHVHRVL